MDNRSPSANALGNAAKRAGKKAGKKTVRFFGKHLKKIIISLVSLIVSNVFFMVIFLGLIAAIGGDQSKKSIEVPASSPQISAAAYAHKDVVEEVLLAFYGEESLQYTNLVLCVIMVESSGMGLDPMQSSECSYNTRFERLPGKIRDVRYSIECGVQYLMDCLIAAGVESADDIDRIRLALQGYNCVKRS